MALPSKADIYKLEFTLDGSTWYKASTNQSIQVNTFEFTLDGSPWWAIGGALVIRPGDTPTFKIFAGETAVTKMYAGSAAVTKVYLGSTLV